MPKDILVLILMVLLPLVPAFLLFKFLASRAEVSGPASGFQIQLGGAVGGYFAIFLILITAFRHLLPGGVAVWEVRGSVKAEDMGGPPSLASFYLVPGFTFHSDGTFVMKVYAPNDDLPELQITATGYQTGYRELKKLTAGASGNAIDLNTIVLVKPPPLPAQPKPALTEKP